MFYLSENAKNAAAAPTATRSAAAAPKETRSAAATAAAGGSATVTSAAGHKLSFEGGVEGNARGDFEGTGPIRAYRLGQVSYSPNLRHFVIRAPRLARARASYKTHFYQRKKLSALHRLCDLLELEDSACFEVLRQTS